MMNKPPEAPLVRHEEEAHALDRVSLDFMVEPTYTVRALDELTWAAFAALVEHNNGVFGGCWCMGFHPEGFGRGTTPTLNRERKLARVRAGTAHAALVFDGDDCVGWCQFGAPDEVPRIKSRAAYEKAGRPRRTGGSRAATSVRGAGAREWPLQRSPVRSTSSRASAGDRRGIPGGRQLGARWVPLQRRLVDL
jgi:hypothetical protein